MFKIFRVFLLMSIFILSSSIMAESKLDEDINRFSNKSIETKSHKSKLENSIKKIESNLLRKSITTKEKKELLKQRENAVLDKWITKANVRRNTHYLRYLHSRKFQKMDLKITPNGVCKNPCQVTMEAIAEKKN